MVDGSRAAQAAPIQRVRFSKTDNFVGKDHEPAALPKPLNKALSDKYKGKTEESVEEVDLSTVAADAKLWLTQDDRLSEPLGETIKAQVGATDWEKLGESVSRRIDMAPMSQPFFDQQTALTGQLSAEFSDFIAANPGKPLRVASFKFERTREGALVTNWTAKEIEPLVAPTVEAKFLSADERIKELRATVRENVNQTLFSAGQFQWIAANWGTISQTHDVYVDVDFYPNRMPDAGGRFHKDSVGETLFVNLTYNNSDPGLAAPEYIPDNQGHPPFEQGMPQAATDLIGQVRADGLADDAQIDGIDLPERGRVSFLDPSIWHSTPYYGRRPPRVDLPYDDAASGTFDQIRQDAPLTADKLVEAEALRRIEAIENELTLNGAQWKKLLPGIPDMNVEDSQVIKVGAVRAELRKKVLRSELEKVNRLVGGQGTTGAALKAGFKHLEPFRMAARAGESTMVDTAPAKRRERSRSVDLQRTPDKEALLQQQATQARSFIRTWVILRAKPQQGS
ncbi:MAG: hypothetical protein WA840_12520 [Caulobacteraceae bacterium]